MQKHILDKRQQRSTEMDMLKFVATRLSSSTKRYLYAFTLGFTIGCLLYLMMYSLIYAGSSDNIYNTGLTTKPPTTPGPYAAWFTTTPGPKHGIKSASKPLELAHSIRVIDQKWSMSRYPMMIPNIIHKSHQNTSIPVEVKDIYI